jgi:signal transduction histidine kinase
MLGVLGVVGARGRQFDAAEVSLLSSIADQVGVAVENARLYRQAEQLAVLRERERLARELHDSVTQSLYSLHLLSEAGRQLAAAGDLDRVGGYLERLGDISQQALKEMRLLVYELRPLVLKREGLVGALQQRLDAVEKRAGVVARLLIEGEVELPASVEEGLYRIAQEALNNILKHAGATSVTVTVRSEGDRVELEIADNGTGFDLDATIDHGGMGLVSMRERAEKMGGSFAVLSVPAGGTKVRVNVEVSDG